MKKYVYIGIAIVGLVLLIGVLKGPYQKWRAERQQTEVSEEVHITDKTADRSEEDKIDRENLQGEEKDHADTIEDETLEGIDTSAVSDEVLKKLSISREDFKKEMDAFANENGITAFGKVYSYDELYDGNGEVALPLFFDEAYDEETDPLKDEDAQGRVNLDFVYQKEAGTYLCRMW